MKNSILYSFIIILIVVVTGFKEAELRPSQSTTTVEYINIQQQDSLKKKKRKKRFFNIRSPFFKDNENQKNDSLRYPFRDESDRDEYGRNQRPTMVLDDPSNITTTIVYDPVSRRYILKKMVGSFDYRRPMSMSEEEYRQYRQEVDIKNYWLNRSREDYLNSNKNTSGLDLGKKLVDKLLGGAKISIKPQGSAELTFGINTTKIDNPTLPEDLRKTTSFDFEEKIQMNVNGSIGDNLKMNVGYNTEATFDFENTMKLEYQGKEDDIVKSAEAGNVSMPIANTLITGGQNLFGVKTKLQFGKFSVTTVISQQKGQSSSVKLENGAQVTDYKVDVDQYQANKHFFLSKYFYDHYDEFLQDLPVVKSGITINKIEVWVTNKTSNFEAARNVIGLVDLGESGTNISSPIVNDNIAVNIPENESNNLYDLMINNYSGIRDVNNITNVLEPIRNELKSGIQYEKLENARRLSESEYNLNSRLGYISLNSALNSDEVLAVAFEYTYRGEVKTVGEFTTDGINAPQTLILKLLKGTNLNPDMPTWDYMMKNIYSIGSRQINSEEFELNVMYQNDNAGTDLNYISEGDIANQPLLKVMNLDKLNSQSDPGADGMFDFIEGVTINSEMGIIMFPIIEPFGEHLRAKINNNAIANKYVYQELYTKLQSEAQRLAEKNKFSLKGSYKSESGDEISLNAFNVQPGSVKVNAGGRTLVENIDYTVDYTLGKVKILNQSLIESNTPINIESENNSFFNLQTKTLVGAHVDYEVNKDFNLGATVMHLSEQPLTQKVNIGDEPIANTIWGVNGSFQTESMFLTRMIDKLPFIETKEPSKIMVEGEFAQLIPGHNKSIGKSGTAYIDDFEGTETSIDMKNWTAWGLSSTPQNNKGEFPEAEFTNDLRYGYNRAKMAWYVIDPLFLRNTSNTPGHIKSDKEELSNHYTREIYEAEIWPNKERATGIPTNISVLNLAYYPEERGPYNYDVEGEAGLSSGIDSEGKLKDPETRWAGIMRKIDVNDFESSNIAYIEFWMLDPYIYDKENKGGELLLHLGNISEDVLRDSRKSFENGLPNSALVTDVDTTSWGRVPVIQQVVQAFDNSSDSRQFQDVGMDGLSTQDEKTFFSDYLNRIATSPQLGSASRAFALANNDPSADNYHYFRGSDFDAIELGILDRYKNYNGPDGNSPTSNISPESYPTSATSLPDIEDINKDNTLSETEAYYQYKVSLRPEDLKVGSNFIIDRVNSEVQLPNGNKETVSWYQFKIPITENPESYGNINNFTSIRFMRMIMRGFEKEVVLRFASFDLIRDDWREYKEAVNEDETDISASDAKLDITAINIEENAFKQPVNYILPPGIDRVVDPGNPQLVQLNEQSLLFKVQDLENGKGKAAYKTIGMDIRKYGKILMDVHAEEVPGSAVSDNELHAFMRIGTDYQNNYYEYEIPLKLTPAGEYNGDNKDDRYIVWPDENRFDIALRIFQTIKQLRNNEMRKSNAVEYSSLFERKLSEIYKSNADNENHIVRIKGNPNLANVRTIMIGVKNPSQQDIGSDDGLSKSVECWFNELRLSDFNEKGGWAANLRVNTKLADLGTITVAGSKLNAGFGSIDDGVNERSKDDIFQYDFSASLELGKFFPEKSGIKIPLYYAISEETVSPEYNPLDPDIPLDVALDNAASKQERDSIKNISQKYTKRKSFNVTNMRIEKKNGNPKILDISNVSATYSYNKTYSRDINTAHTIEKNYRGLLSYDYTGRPKLVQPFKNVPFFKRKSMRLLRDFNFYYLPTQFSIRNDISRYYNEVQKRNIENPGILIEPTFDKDFTWKRYYDLKFNLTKELKFDFSATNTSRIDEPEGIVDKDRDKEAYEIWKDSIWNNILDGGRNIQYNHKFNISYRLPLRKIPLLNWTSVMARYSGMYDWKAGPITDDEIELGNTIQNSNNFQVNSQFNMVNLYNKIKLLKKVNREYGRARPRRKVNRVKKVKYAGKLLDVKKAQEYTIYHKLSTKDIDLKLYDKAGRKISAKILATTNNKVKISIGKDIDYIRVRIDGKQEIKDSFIEKVAFNTLRTMMSLRNVSVTYNETNSSMLPGYLPNTNYFGSDRFNNSSAPGFKFLAGGQDKQFAMKAANKGWITKDPTLNNPYKMSKSERVAIRTSFELFRGFKIDINGERSFTKTRSEFYIYNDSDGRFEAKNLVESGNYSISFLSLQSAFYTIGTASNYASKYFDKFLDYRKDESLRLAKQRYGSKYSDYILKDEKGNETGFYSGYGPTSQQVLVPSFLKAYGGKSSGFEKVFPAISQIMPNWKITFNGLSKIPIVKKYFKSVNISHAYNCNYTIGSFTTNLDFVEGAKGLSETVNLAGDYYAKYDLNSVSINEQFNPLINVNMTWKNNLSTRFEIKRTRTLNLGLSNTQLTEIASNEMVIGLGYRFDDFGMIIGQGSKQKKVKSDLNLRGDLSIRKSSTVIRKVVEQVDQLTSGQKVVTLKFSADYTLSSRFNLRFFYDRTINEPYVSLAYPTTTTEFGASLRFTLAN
ncbi:MAG: cell surface protein SprA [Marinifilaceae bacterium]|nr:cell surface protein SprA [Marinifilaceae bacterium]